MRLVVWVTIVLIMTSLGRFSESAILGCPAPDARSRGCCCRTSLPTVIKPLTKAWICNQMPCKVWDEVIYIFLNVNATSEWGIIDFISHYNGCNYLSASVKGAPGNPRSYCNCSQWCVFKRWQLKHNPNPVLLERYSVPNFKQYLHNRKKNNQMFWGYFSLVPFSRNIVL